MYLINHLKYDISQITNFKKNNVEDELKNFKKIEDELKIINGSFSKTDNRW